MVVATNHSFGFAALGLGFLSTAYFGYLSGHTWDAFTAHLSQEFSPFYLLWIGLACSFAWRRLGPVSN
jgi:hypothetical protein